MSIIPAMRNLACLAALSSLLLACNSSEGGSADSGPPDAPPLPDVSPAPDAPPPIDAAWPDAPPLPDLVLMAEMITPSIEQDSAFFSTNSCSLEEMCIDATGQRDLLRFDTVTMNAGGADLVVGTPGSGNPLFIWSDCHGHYHFTHYATYELVGPTGVVATGRKQAFCLEDTDNISSPDGPTYTCSYQGISMGWADTYSTALPCQWIDITGVPAGDYTLRITINPEHILLEADYNNNVYEQAVTIN
jgi:hypothetical protein